MKKQLPCFFEDIPYDEEFYNTRLKGYVDNLVEYKPEYTNEFICYEQNKNEGEI
jgi:hypothetical protein